MITSLEKLNRGQRLIPIINPTNCASPGQSNEFCFPLNKADFPCHPIPLNKAIHILELAPSRIHTKKEVTANSPWHYQL